MKKIISKMADDDDDDDYVPWWCRDPDFPIDKHKDVEFWKQLPLPMDSNRESRTNISTTFRQRRDPLSSKGKIDILDRNQPASASR